MGRPTSERGERDRAFAQIAGRDGIGDAERERLLGFDLPAARGQIDRGAHADEARQALRAAGAGNEAELDLRQADDGAAASSTRAWQASASSKPPPSAVP